jgi:hypothetical protein
MKKLFSRVKLNTGGIDGENTIQSQRSNSNDASSLTVSTVAAAEEVVLAPVHVGMKRAVPASFENLAPANKTNVRSSNTPTHTNPPINLPITSCIEDLPLHLSPAIFVPVPSASPAHTPVLHEPSTTSNGNNLTATTSIPTGPELQTDTSATANKTT